MAMPLMPLPLRDPFCGAAKPSIHRNTEEDGFSYIYKVLNTPWDFTAQVPSEIKHQHSRVQLQADLAELARGTKEMARPTRWTASKDGGIGAAGLGGKVAWPPRPTSFDPWADKCDASSSPESITSMNIPILAPIPVVPAGPALRAHFRVKAYSAPLSPAKAAFVESFQSLPRNENNNNTVRAENHALADTIADDDDVIVYMKQDVAPQAQENSHALSYEATTDENRPPAAPFVSENENAAQASVIPAPHLRGTRQPFGVLHYDAENAPSPLRDDEVPYPVLYETATRVSVTAPRGWARLRPMAPSPINVEEVNRKMEFVEEYCVDTSKEDTSRGPNAPSMNSVPLLNVASFGTLEKAPVKQAGRIPSMAKSMSFLELLDAINPVKLAEERRRWQMMCPV